MRLGRKASAFSTTRARVCQFQWNSFHFAPITSCETESALRFFQSGSFINPSRILLLQKERKNDINTKDFLRLGGRRTLLPNPSSAAATSCGYARGSLINRPIRNQPRGEKVVHRYSKGHGKKRDSLVGNGGTTSFHVGNDLAGHVTPKQLHSGREHVLRPALLKTKSGDIPSNDVCLSTLSHLCNFQINSRHHTRN